VVDEAAPSDFEQFCEVQQQSAAENGFDAYHPCLWIIGESIVIQVLETDLSPQGEEELAKDWAGQEEGDYILLGYRASSEEIHLCEVIARDVTQKVVLRRGT